MLPPCSLAIRLCVFRVPHQPAWPLIRHAMSDSGWMRLLNGPRSRPAGLPGSSSSEPSNMPHQGLKQNSTTASQTVDTLPEYAPLPSRPRPLPRLTSWHGSGRTSPVPWLQPRQTAENDIIFRESDRVWHNPTVDQMTEALLAAMMTKSPTEPLPAEYSSFVLNLIEGYGKMRQKVDEVESLLRAAEALQTKQESDFQDQAAEWHKQEARYRAEIKRLEMVIQRESRDGLQAVALARAGSLIKPKGSPGRPTPRSTSPSRRSAILVTGNDRDVSTVREQIIPITTGPMMPGTSTALEGEASITQRSSTHPLGSHGTIRKPKQSSCSG